MLPAGIVYPFETDYNGEVEIVYHRKDWGWRNEIMNTFGWRAVAVNEYCFEINTPDEVLTLIDITAGWLDKERWENYGDSIWSYDEAHKHLVQDIVNFALIMAFMQSNPDVYIEFYDSY